MDSYLFVIFTRLFLIIHSSIDCLCTLATLFPRLIIMIEKWKIKYVFFNELYPSIFKQIIDDSNMTTADLPLPPPQTKNPHAITTTSICFLIYWVAAMGLTRAAAGVFPHKHTLCIAGIMYILEALVAEYEGFTTQTIPAKTARVMSIASTCLCGMCWYSITLL